MHMFGNANWYFPKWLNRITPRVSVEPPDEESDWIDSAPEVVSAR
jgi:RND superfamily putative drug exporter